MADRVRAFAKLVTEICRACYEFAKYVHTIVVLCRWLSVRLEMLGICIVFGAALFVAVLLPRNAGLAGLALTSALNLTGQESIPLCMHDSCQQSAVL